ncbi:Uncharacterised protein [Vibrio cholerae]|uniref:Uncharacterized protein n=1 Tax=Vibrio cholerae TaxID=666 RepID=A0A656AK97_VIBCL|nr:Uncharacterised protein [Vibrio cholerae]CSD14030.1 Uncharacterised protein [Vibrio cholerae]
MNRKSAKWCEGLHTFINQTANRYQQASEYDQLIAVARGRKHSIQRQRQQHG